MYRIESLIIFFFVSCLFGQNLEKQQFPFIENQIEKSILDSLKSNYLALNHINNDSLMDLLRYKDTVNYKCIDINCYIKVTEYNLFLNTFVITSLKNRDSVLTNLLFALYRNKYVDLQSVRYDKQLALIENDCDSTNVYYTICLLTSTDSSLIENSLKKNEENTLQLLKNLKISNVKHEINDSDIVNYIFYFQKDFLDFQISKSNLDSAIIGEWSPPLKSSFGFYSFKMVGKNLNLCGYSEISNKIKYERLKNDLNLLDSSDISFSNNDTLIVKFWARPVSLFQKKTLINIDTNSIEGIQTTDFALPHRIRKLIRDNYYKSGILFFNNFKNEYCIWSLKIIKVINGKDNVNFNNDYAIARRISHLIEYNTIKNEEKANSTLRNNYLSSLYKQNCIKNGLQWNEKKVPFNIIDLTKKEIDKDAYEWIKNNVNLINLKINEQYLPVHLK